MCRPLPLPMPPLSMLLLLLLFATQAVLCCPTPRESNQRYSQISPEIVNELKDFADLIPAARVDELIAKHYVLDGGFRKALEYVRSAQFSKLLAHLQEMPEIIEILDFLHLRVEQQPRQGRRIACALLHALPASLNEVDIVLLDERETLLQRHAYNLRSFTSFVEELLLYLPRDRYLRMINEKRQKSAAFAEFYAALRSVQLQPMVEAAMKSANVAAVIRSLLANAVDVHSLEPVAFKVISWGPDL